MFWPIILVNLTNIRQIESESKTTTLIDYFNQSFFTVKVHLQLCIYDVIYYQHYHHHHHHHHYHYYYYYYYLYYLYYYYCYYCYYYYLYYCYYYYYYCYYYYYSYTFKGNNAFKFWSVSLNASPRSCLGCECAYSKYIKLTSVISVISNFPILKIIFPQ